MSQPGTPPRRGQPEPPVPAGWYPDPARRFPQRYWDGVRWSEYVSYPGGAMGTDPPLPVVLPDASPTGKVSSPPSRVRNPTAAIIVLVGAAVLALGSVLPWATVRSPIFGNSNVSGIRGDGQITLVLAIVLAVLGAVVLSGRARNTLLIAARVIAAMAALTCAVDLNDVSRVARRATGIPVNASVGYGLYVALVGSICAGIGSIIGLTKR